MSDSLKGVILWFSRVLSGLCLATAASKADSTWVYSVQVSATVQSNPPSIDLNWIPDEYGASSYTVSRKERTDAAWGPGVVLSGTTSNFTDTDVEIGRVYEYQVAKTSVVGYKGHGYICTGIQVPPQESRGGLVLVIADNIAGALAAELNRLENDLVGDGWRVYRHVVSVNATPQTVRGLITSDYYTHPGIQAVFLLGHIPVFHSGNLNYDGHQSRPMPADAYYADVDGDWSSSPGFLPSDIELMIGRVDLADMPGSGSPAPWPDEIELLRNYLNKNHAWRHGLLNVPRRALMGDRRGVDGGNAPASSGYRAFDPLLGHGQTLLADTSDTASPSQRWISRLSSEWYLWAYGCGGGQPSGISHLGTRGQYFDAWSIDVVNLDAKAVFVMLYGSWFGNWDGPDNFLRSFLATPTLGLACVMSGVPHWFVHHMGLGEPIGSCARVTMNNAGLYQNNSNSFLRANYVALMGDPTLRMHPFSPPSALAATAQAGATLTWTAAPAAVLGYHVYRSNALSGSFVRLTSSPIQTTQFLDVTASPGLQTYMVRAMREEITASGTFFNLSQGAFASVNITQPSAPIVLSAERKPEGMLLRWNTQAGFSYRVLGSEDLQTWSSLSGSLSAGGDSLSWLDSQEALVQRFYRVSSP